MIEIKKLSIKHQEKQLLDIAFEIDSSLALVGQSGSGKSLTLKALLGMLPQSMKLDLQLKAAFVLKAGESVAFVPQNPFTALSPLTKIKKQFFVPNSRVEELFRELNLELSFLERFPPELSGGQLQRVVLALALSKKPKLLLLDEPTTALDPQSRENIIELLKKLQKLEGFSMLFVTHDIVSAAQLCESICVLHKGKIVETGKMATILKNPQELYTKTLIEANFINRAFRK